MTEQSTSQKHQAGAKQLCLDEGLEYSVVLDDYKAKYDELIVKYDGLLQKSHSLCKQVFYCKTRYDADMASKYKVDRCISRNDAFEFFITDMMKSEDIFMKVNRKPAAARTNFRRQVARQIWNDEREFCQELCKEFYNLLM